MELVAGIIGCIAGTVFCAIACFGLIRFIKREDEHYAVRIAKEKEIVECLLRWQDTYDKKR